VEAVAKLSRNVAEWLARAQTEDVAEDASMGYQHDEPNNVQLDNVVRKTKVL
jgi:hypothetical protein